MPETIHSGQFMSTLVHSGIDREEVEEEECEGDMQAADVNPEDQPACEKPVTFYKFTLENTRTVDIEFSLTKLYHCVELAYKGIATPKWKKFSGMKIEWKDRIRLNNVIWRAWHMQFIHRLKPKFCYFSLPEEDQHRKQEATLVEGMYWKRRYETVGAEYNRWRHFFYRRNHHTMAQKEKKSGKIQRGDSLDDAVILPYPSDFSNLEDDEWGNWVTDHLFSSLNQPYMFPNPKEMAQAGNADIIQPGLVQLQPSMEEILANLGYVTESNSPCLGQGNHKEFGKFSSNGSPSAYDYSTSSLRDTPETTSFVDVPIKQPTVEQSSLTQYHMAPITESNGSTYVNLMPPVVQSNIRLNQPYGADIQPATVVKSHPRNVPIAPKKRIHFFSKEMGMCDDSSISGSGAQPIQVNQSVASLTPIEDGMAELRYMASPSNNSSNLTASTVHHLPLSQAVPQRCDIPTGPPTVPYQVRPGEAPVFSSNPIGFNINTRPAVTGNRPIINQQRPPLISPQRQQQCSQDPYQPQKPMKNETEFYTSSEHIVKHREAQPAIRNVHGINVQFQQPNIMDVSGQGEMKAQHQQQVFVTTGGGPTVISQLSRNSSVVRPVPINLLSPGRSDASAFSSISPCSSGSSPLSPPQMRLTSGDYGSNMSSNSHVAVLGSTNSPNFVQMMNQPSTSQNHHQQQFLIYQPFHNIPVMAIPCSYSPSDKKVSSPMAEDQKMPLLRYNVADYASQPGSSGSSQDSAPKKEAQAHGSKRSLKRAADSTVDASEKKRLQHLMSEHSRRSALKTGFEQLEAMLPNLSQEGNKITNALVLMRAGQHIRSLKQKSAGAESEIENLKAEAAELNNRISSYQNHLPTGKTDSKGGNLHDLYSQFVKTRTNENWKFWLQAELMKPLFETFCAEVDGQTEEELKVSAANWAAKNANLRTLRPSLSKVLLDLATETQVLSNAQCLEEFSLNQAAKL